GNRKRAPDRPGPVPRRPYRTPDHVPALLRRNGGRYAIPYPANRGGCALPGTAYRRGVGLRFGTRPYHFPSFQFRRPLSYSVARWILARWMGRRARSLPQPLIDTAAPAQDQGIGRSLPPTPDQWLD